MKNRPVEKYKVKLKEVDVESSSEFKKITCPSCSQDTAADGINIQDKIAKCNHCHVVFSFKNEITDLLNQKKIKQEIIRPEGIDLFYFKDDLDITIEQPISVLESIIMIVGVSSMVFPTIAWVENGGTFLMPLLFNLFIIAISAIYLFNRPKHKIYLTIDDQFLSMIWRPKKFNKDQHYAVKDIDQIYVKEKDGNYQLFMMINSLAGQKHVKLLGGLEGQSKARFLEQEIERHLEIPDRKVPEETV